ncbi:HEAT repeat domain-containing protein [Herpetosiphon giganteus]|uniref:HEAT repeat domain-containing protein n=1 Tax=Herpetosiphon giganteus TaxID=2029754 RepID=UPI00195AD2D9|nr:HEAT repeat domain-containing protein [Herpetosiphon giganteus]MBM7843570.1 HEAT repeat protein [Herpetosiphon giganteus]
MNRDQLLAEFEQLSDNQRIKRMVALGQQVANDPQIGQLIEQFAQSPSIYQRRLALWSCYGSHDSSLIGRFISDPAQSLVRLAINLMGVYCTDADVAASLGQLAAPFWRKALKLLAKQGRFAIIDGFLATLEPAQLAQYAIFGSQQYYNQQQASIIQRFSPREWGQLARFKPLACVASINTFLQQSAQSIQQKQAVLSIALPKLATRQPDPALGLVQTALDQQLELNSLPLQALAHQRPQAIANLLIQQQQTVELDWDHLVSKLRLEQVLRLAELNLLPRWATWLRKTPISYRSALYAALHRQWYDERLLLQDYVWDALPSNERQHEARRAQHVPHVEMFPILKIQHAAYLPWDEAWEIVQPALKHSEAEWRGEAIASLIKIVRYQPEYAQTVLDLVNDRRNEQDPVRVKLLTALSDLPARRWQSQHLASIEQIMRASLNARDCSDTSIQLLQRWLSKLLAVHPEASMALIGQMSRERGKLFVQSYGGELNAAEAQALCAVLLPIMRTWQRAQQIEDILSIVYFIGRSIKDVPELITMLEQIANEQLHWAAKRALDALHSYARPHFNQLVPQLLANDPSWITQRLILNFVQSKRQDLLTPFLPAQAYEGKFSTGDAAYMLPIQHGFERWTTKQQQIFAQTLIEQTHNPDLQHPTLIDYAQRLAHLSEVAPTRLIELAQLNAPIEVLRDKALEALSRRETNDGVPTLIEALADGRARVAIYALRRVLLRMPTNQALDILRNVPSDRVTVTKETVRLLGDLKNQVAYQELLRWNGLELHNDVRIALVHALSNYLEHPETWQILASIGQHDDPNVVDSLTDISLKGQPPAIQQRYLKLVAGLLEHPDGAVRRDALMALSLIPDPDRLLVQPIIAIIASDSHDLLESSIISLVQLYGISAIEVVAAIVRRFLTKRFFLYRFVEHLTPLLEIQPSFLPLGHAIVAELASDRLTTQLQIQLAARCYTEQAWFDFVQQLSQKQLLHVDNFRAVLDEMDYVENTIWLRQPDKLENFFYPSNDPYLRRIGLAAFIRANYSKRFNCLFI